MDIQALVRALVAVDYLDEWPQLAESYSAKDRVSAFKKAEPQWLTRMAHDGKLYIHPEVLKELASAQWKPTDLQRRMIWASVLASLDGPDSKARFNALKVKLIKKYDNTWWLDVYRRIRPTYGARMWIEKIHQRNGPALNYMAANSTLVGLAVQEQREKALRSIPRA